MHRCTPFALLVACAVAMPAWTAPRIQLELAELDFGLVPNHETTTREVTVSNPGSETLRISEIKSTCPCTGGALSEKTLAPGASTTLTVTIDPAKTMAFETGRNLYLLSNDPDRPAAEIRVLSRIEPEFSVEPNPLALGDVPVDEERRVVVRFRSHHPEPVRIERVEAGPDSKGFEVRLQPLPQDRWSRGDQPEYDIHLKIPGGRPIGPVTYSYYLATNNARVPSFEGRVLLNSTSFYRIDTRLLDLGAVRPGQTRTVSTITAKEPLTVVGVRTINPAYTAAVHLSDNDRTATVQLTLPDDLSGRAAQEITVQLESGGQEIHETIRIIGTVED